jgi:acetyltransferase
MSPDYALGGVVVGIQNDEEACRAFDRVRAVAAGKTFCGALIYPQISGGREVLVGMTRDPQFGPVVAFGLGGIYTEILHDISLRIAPCEKETALEMIREIRTFPLLDRARNQAPCDLDALAELLAKFSLLVVASPEIAEMDVNPVFAMPDCALVGDVRVIRGDRQIQSS